MAINFREWEHRRTLYDRLICGLLTLKFSITEPIFLRFARCCYWRRYQKRDENPLISIVMTTFKRPQVLTERCLPSILNQTYQNFEVVITGDSRLDDTAKRVRKLDDPRIRFYDVPEWEHYPKELKSRWYVAGMPSRNVALSLARGAWIAEMDDDAIMLPDHLEALLRFAQQGEYEFVSAAYEVERYGKRSIVDGKDTRPHIGGVETWLFRSYLRFFRWNVQSWRKHYNRPPDIDRQLRMGFAGVRTGFLDKVVTLILPVPGKETTGLDTLTEDRYDFARKGT